MVEMVVCGFFAGCGGVLLLLRSQQSDGLFHKAVGLFVLVTSVLYAVTAAKEQLVRELPIWHLVGWWAFGAALMPMAPVIGGILRRRRQRREL
jgi:hypothetical protein